MSFIEIPVNDLDINFDVEIGTGVTSVVYPGVWKVPKGVPGLEPKPIAIAVKVLHAHYKPDHLRDPLGPATVLSNYDIKSKQLLLQPWQDHLVDVFGFTQLPFGQRQCALITERSATTLDRLLTLFVSGRGGHGSELDLHRQHSSLVTLLQYVLEAVTVLEGLSVAEAPLTDEELANSPVYAGEAYLPPHQVAIQRAKRSFRGKLLFHNEIHPSDILICTGSPPAAVNPQELQEIEETFLRVPAAASTSRRVVKFNHVKSLLHVTGGPKGSTAGSGPPLFVPAVASRYCDPEFSVTGASTVDSDLFSLGVMLWEIVERQKAPVGVVLPFPSNTLVPRELRHCISLCVAASRHKRPTITSLREELDFAVKAMIQREVDDADYKRRRTLQDSLHDSVQAIMIRCMDEIQKVYSSATRDGVGYAIEVEAEVLSAGGGHLRGAVSGLGSAVDIQFRRRDAKPEETYRSAFPMPLLSNLSALGLAPPTASSSAVSTQSAMENAPPTSSGGAMPNIDIILATETIDLSDGHPKVNFPIVRVSNYRQLDITPTIEYANGVEGFLAGEFAHIEMVDLSSLALHVRKVGDFFLYGCRMLKTIDVTGFQFVTVIGFAFLGGCSSLREIDLSPLSNVVSVGGNFLHSCTGLQELDLTPLSNVVDLGSHFLAGCTGLRKVKLPRLLKIDMVNVFPEKWVEDTERWWEWTGGVRIYFYNP